MSKLIVPEVQDTTSQMRHNNRNLDFCLYVKSYSDTLDTASLWTGFADASETEYADDDRAFSVTGHMYTVLY